MRVLLPRELLLPISNIYPDLKIKCVDDYLKLETFCFSNGIGGGKIKYLKYDGGITNLDGHISVCNSGDIIQNTVYGNFAVLFENIKSPVHFEDVSAKLKCLNNSPECEKLNNFLEKILSIIADINNISLNDVKKQMQLLKWEIENIWPKIKTDNGFWVKDDIILERQREGIAIAKAKGKYKGGVKKLSEEQINEIKAVVNDRKTNITQLAKKYRITRQTIYNLIKEEK